MDDLLWPRVLAAFAVDASLAVLCGRLLCDVWLGDEFSSRADGPRRSAAVLRIFSLLLLIALSVQLMLLAASFSGQTLLHVMMASMLDVCTTHAGILLLASCGVALMLTAATMIPFPRFRPIVCGVLVIVALCLHAATGHAANDGTVSLAEFLQLIHVLGMAVWSGCVIVSGLAIVPRLQRHASGEAALAAPSQLAAYLARLSLASTWSVGAVIFSGLIKAAIATGASLHVIRSSHWGQVLTVKVAFVTLTVLLGAKNRWLLASAVRQGSSDFRQVARTLRLEGFAMLAVLVLSAWLANSPPPLD